MPAPIVLSTLTPETKRVLNPPTGQPKIATKAELRDGSRPTSSGGGGGGDPVPGQGLIFSENFANQPNWTGSQSLAAAGVTGWFKSRNGEIQFTEQDAIEITDQMPEALRNGTGKSLVCWRESHNEEPSASNNFNKDGQLDWYTEAGLDRVYVKFWLKFQNGWTPTGLNKMFRIMSWDEGDPNNFYAFFSGGDSAPIMIWQYSYSDFGVRNFFNFRGDPQESNYVMTAPSPTDLPRAFINGDIDCNFDENLRDLDGDGNDENSITMIDLETGLPLTPGQKEHSNIYGDVWHKVEFFVEMNSAPGVRDGTLKQWIDDQLCFSNTQMPWMGTDSPGNKKWNVVGFGGNGRFSAYPNSERVQEWCAFTEIEIHDSLPESLQ